MWKRFKSLFTKEDEDETGEVTANETSRQRSRPRPRKEWLVAVGQGQSPARTLRRESRGGGANGSKSPRRKKFDTARLSFGGLEQDRPPSLPQSPSPAGDGTGSPTPSSPVSVSPPRLRKTRPSPARSPPMSSRRHRYASTASRNAFAGGGEMDRSGSPAGDPSAQASASPRRGGGGVGYSLSRPLALEPTSSREARPDDWFSAAIAEGKAAEALSATATSARNRKDNKTGGDAADAGGGGRDAKLNSLLVLSPGKEYWAGRLAEKGSRDSENPRTAARNREKSRDGFAVGRGDCRAPSSQREVNGSVSPSRKGQGKAPRSTERKQRKQRQQQLGASRDACSKSSTVGEQDSLSFRESKKIAPPPPSAITSTSPGGSGGVGDKGLPSPTTGEVQQPGQAYSLSPRLTSPPTAVSWSPANAQRRRPDLDPSSRVISRKEKKGAVAPVRRAAESDSPEPLACGGEVSSSDRAFSPRECPLGAGVRARRQSVSPSDKKGPIETSFRQSGRSASPISRKAQRYAPDSRLASPSSGYGINSRGRPLSRDRVTDPSSLPLAAAGIDGKSFGSGRGGGSPERTTKVSPRASKRDSPERTGQVRASDCGAAAAAAAAATAVTVVSQESIKKGDDVNGADASGGGAARLELQESDGKQTTLQGTTVSAGVHPPMTRGGAKGLRKEPTMVLALPPATEGHFVGSLPEECSAPFRLLFQMFAVAGWP